jgi:hypothetical protein
VKAFHSFVDYPSSGGNKSGSPGCVFAVEVTAGYEALPKGIVVGGKLPLCNYWVGWEMAEMVRGQMKSTTDTVSGQSCNRGGGDAG